MTKKEKRNYSYLASVLSLVCALSLALLHTLWTPEQTNRLGNLIIAIIPSAIVVLISFPIVYFLLIRKGISVLSVQGTDTNEISDIINNRLRKELALLYKNKNFSSNLEVRGNTDQHAEPMRKIEEEVKKITKRINNIENHGATIKSIPRDALIVVDVQNDFFENGALPVADASSLIQPLNDAIAKAEQAGALIIYTQDWHPKNHKSFKGNGGPWYPHCIQGTHGAKLHPDLKEATASEIIKFGTDPELDGYSPFENKEMVSLIDRPEIKEVFVVGIAAEFCVLATCIEAQKYKNVTVIESLIHAAEPDKLSETWITYDKYRVRRLGQHPWHG
jgi:nicotinamidase/pyrazinamidase